MNIARSIGLIAVLSFGLGPLSAAVAEEHSKEHPKEHPTEHPKPAVLISKEDFSKIVDAQIKKASETSDGFYVVNDNVMHKSWWLKLDKIHTDKIVKLSDTKCFACADFKASDGAVDLDFYMTKGKDGWAVSEVIVHKVDGKPRFMYNEKNERVPLKEEK